MTRGNDERDAEVIAIDEIREQAPHGGINPVLWQGKPIPPRPWVVPELIPDLNVTMLSADGGLGKTLITLQLLVAKALGRPWLGIDTSPAPVLGLFCEDDRDELHRRLADIVKHYEVDFADLSNVRMISRVDLDSALADFTADHAIASKFCNDLADYADYCGARVLVLDSLHDLFIGNEVSRVHARQFIGLLRQLALRIRGAVVVNAHPSLSGLANGTGSSGSTAWNNAVRSRLYLTRPSCEEAGEDVRILSTQKLNYGPLGEDIELRWEDGVFVRQASIAADPYREAEGVFLDCLEKVTAEGRYVSNAKNSPNFAPTVFAQMPLSRRLGKKKLTLAMHNLFGVGKIKIGEHRQPNRHSVNAIVRAQ